MRFWTQQTTVYFHASKYSINAQKLTTSPLTAFEQKLK